MATKKTKNSEIRKAYLAGMKRAHEIDSEKMGQSFGSSGKVKEDSFKEYLKNN